MGRTRVLIAEDVSLWRDGLCAYLAGQEDLELLGVTESVAETKRKAAESVPDVVVVDMAMERVSGPVLAQELVNDHGNVRVVMLTMCEDEQCVKNILEIGVMGLVLKRSQGAELVKAIRAAAQGELYVDPDLRPQVLCEFATQRAGHETLESLDPQERELCRLLALGYTNAESSKLLNVPVRKVETLRSRVMSKIGAGTRAELVSFALSAGLL